MMNRRIPEAAFVAAGGLESPLNRQAGKPAIRNRVHDFQET